MKKYIIIIVIIYVIFIYFNKAYIKYYPTIPLHPNSNNEVNHVKHHMDNITQSDIDFFYLTNESVTNAFLPYVKENKTDIQKIGISQNYIILFFKYFINRIRPYQIDKNIKPINIDTAQSPAYPAGHAYQAYLIAKVLSKKYPEKKILLHQIASNCDICRVKAGLHYPSDGIFSKKLVDFFNP